MRLDAILFKITFEGSRQHERVELTLPGRYMLQGRREYPCRTTDVSAGGLAIESEEKGRVGDPIIAYINQLGRIEGVVARQMERGFAVKMLAPAHKSEKLAKRIAWLAESQIFGMSDNRQHERVAPADERVVVRTPDGAQCLATLIDISSQGAALHMETTPPIGAALAIGDKRAHVVRHFAGGVGVAFLDVEAA